MSGRIEVADITYVADGADAIILTADGHTFRYVPERTCRYVPELCMTVIDEDGHEVETDEPHEECDVFYCSYCGYEMRFGPEGWFDEEPPYKPYFLYCPGCGARVGVKGHGDL